MKTINMTLLSALGLLGLQQTAAADESGFYAGASYQVYDLDSNNGIGSNDDINGVSGLQLTAGYAFNKYFSAEGELMFGLETTEKSVQGNSAELVDVGFNQGFGAYGKASLPIGENFAVFGRAGFTNLSFDVRDPVNAGSTLDVDDSGLAWGGGFEFRFGENGNNAIRFDFIDASLDALPTQIYGISYNRRF